MTDATYSIFDDAGQRYVSHVATTASDAFHHFMFIKSAKNKSPLISKVELHGDDGIHRVYSKELFMSLLMIEVCRKRYLFFIDGKEHITIYATTNSNALRAFTKLDLDETFYEVKVQAVMPSNYQPLYHTIATMDRQTFLCQR